MQRNRLAVIVASAGVAAAGLLIADRAEFGLWGSLALAIGLLLSFAAITAPFVLASSERRIERETAILRSLLQRDENLRLEAPRWAQIGPGGSIRRHTQRAFDVIGSGLLLILFAPLMVAIALALKLESRGPILFRRHVVGREGEPFHQLKFRTMYIDAEQRAKELSDSEAPEGVMFRIRRDPRLTRVGRFIRRFSLDELPQLFSVLKGDMSLVGPPPLEDEYRVLRGLLQLTRPGLTGVWRTLDDLEVTAPDLARAELVYFVNRSVWSDLKLCTVGRYSTRRRAITTMWTLAAEDQAAGVKLESDTEMALTGKGDRAQLPLVDLAPKRSIG